MALLPKFSIRQMLLAMIALALLSACIAGAVRGNVFAFGFSVAVLTIIVPAVCFAVGYWICLAIALLTETVFAHRNHKMSQGDIDSANRLEAGER